MIIETRTTKPQGCAIKADETNTVYSCGWEVQWLSEFSQGASGWLGETLTQTLQKFLEQPHPHLCLMGTIWIKVHLTFIVSLTTTHQRGLPPTSKGILIVYSVVNASFFRLNALRVLGGFRRNLHRHCVIATHTTPVHNRSCSLIKSRAMWHSLSHSVHIKETCPHIKGTINCLSMSHSPDKQGLNMMTCDDTEPRSACEALATILKTHQRDVPPTSKIVC